MVRNNNLWNELKVTFDQDLPATTQLLELLQAERKSLETRNYDQFQIIIAEKQSLLSQLEKHAKKRQQLLTNAGFNDESSILNAAEQQNPAIASIWRKLGKQWKQCQELNEVNERIAKRTRLVVSQILDLLRGQNNQERLYTNKGNPSTPSGGRTITSA